MAPNTGCHWNDRSCVSSQWSLQCFQRSITTATHRTQRRDQCVRELCVHGDSKQVCQCDLHTGETLPRLRAAHQHSYTHTIHTHIHTGQDRWRIQREHLNPSTLCIRMKSGKSSDAAFQCYPSVYFSYFLEKVLSIWKDVILSTVSEIVIIGYNVKVITLFRVNVIIMTNCRK